MANVRVLVRVDLCSVRDFHHSSAESVSKKPSRISQSFIAPAPEHLCGDGDSLLMRRASR